MEAVDSVMEVDSAMEVVGLVMEAVDSAVEGEGDSAMEVVGLVVCSTRRRRNPNRRCRHRHRGWTSWNHHPRRRPSR